MFLALQMRAFGSLLITFLIGRRASHVTPENTNQPVKTVTTAEQKERTFHDYHWPKSIPKGFF